MPRYQLNRRRPNLADWKATDAHRLTRIFSSWIAELVLICVSSVLICGVNEFIHARAYSRASEKASQFARGVRVRVRAEGVDNFFAQKNKLSVAVYEKGPKVLVQGEESRSSSNSNWSLKFWAKRSSAMKKCTCPKCSSRISEWTRAGKAISSGLW